MRASTSVHLVLTTLGIAACQTPRDTVAARDTTKAGADAKVDKQAEEQAIRGMEKRWRDALAAKDSAAIGRFYAGDAYYLPQNSDGYQGPDKIRDRWAGEFTGGKFVLERNPKKIEVADAGDMAYEVGTYTVSWDKPRQHQNGQGAGNYVTVWKKDNGEWKTVAYIWNRGEQPEKR
jgi:ketosteroid isomerase-like protein